MPLSAECKLCYDHHNTAAATCKKMATTESCWAAAERGYCAFDYILRTSLNLNGTQVRQTTCFSEGQELAKSCRSRQYMTETLGPAVTVCAAETLGQALVLVCKLLPSFAVNGHVTSLKWPPWFLLLCRFRHWTLLHAGTTTCCPGPRSRPHNCLS